MSKKKKVIIGEKALQRYIARLERKIKEHRGVDRKFFEDELKIFLLDNDERLPEKYRLPYHRAAQK